LGKWSLELDQSISPPLLVSNASAAFVLNVHIVVVYDPPSFLVRDEVIGQGSTHQAAREDSARKLLELGYCVSFGVDLTEECFDDCSRSEFDQATRCI
jgi:hypothetical protein